MLNENVYFLSESSAIATPAKSPARVIKEIVFYASLTSNQIELAGLISFHNVSRNYMSNFSFI